MQLLIQPPTSRICSIRQERLLQSARQKLLDPQIPLLLRMTDFLKLSCLVLERPGAYSHLIKALTDYSPEWWCLCEITSIGTLTSYDREIEKQLSIVSHLHF